MLIAQQLAGYTLGKADLLRRAMGKKKREVLDAEFVGFSRRHDGQRLLRWRPSRRCGTSSSRSPTTRSTRRTPRRTAWCPTGRPTSRPTTRPSTWRRCSPASATTRTSRRSTSTSAAGWASRCCRRTSTSPTPTTPRAAPTSGSAWPRSATSATNVVASIAATREAKGRFTDFYDFLRKVDPVVCNKKTVESLIKAGAFDSLGAPAPRPARRARRGHRLVHGHQAQRGARPVRPVRRRRRRRRRRGRRSRSSRRCRSGSGTRASCSQYEREMLGLYVSDHPLFGVEHVLASAADCSIATLTGSDDRAGRLARHDRRPGQRPAAQGHQEGRRLGDRHHRGPRGRDRGACSSRRPTSCSRPALAEDAVVVVRGRLDRRDDVPKLIAMELSLPDLSEGPRGPVVISLPVVRCTPPVVERLKEVLATHPGATEVHLRLQAASRTTVLRIDDGLRVNPTPGADGRPQGAARPRLPGLTRGVDRPLVIRSALGRPVSAPVVHTDGRSRHSAHQAATDRRADSAEEHAERLFTRVESCHRSAAVTTRSNDVVTICTRGGNHDSRTHCFASRPRSAVWARSSPWSAPARSGGSEMDTVTDRSGSGREICRQAEPGRKWGC